MRRFLERLIAVRRGARAALPLLLVVIATAHAESPDPRPQQSAQPSKTILPAPALPNESELSGVELDSEIRALAELLDASYEIRERALQQLIDRRVDLRQVCLMLENPRLSAEQRCRLMYLLEAEINAPRGALGISMERVIWPGENGGIEVRKLTAGFPAEKVLRVHDRISHIDGRRLGAQVDLANLVQPKRPGSGIRLNVNRPRRDEHGDLERGPDGNVVFDKLELTLKLGSLDELKAVSSGNTIAQADVLKLRRRETDEAFRRYANRARRFDLDLSQLKHGRAIGLVAMGPIEIFNAMLIDLTKQREAAAVGQLEVTEAVRTSWERLEGVLADIAARHDVTAHDRLMMRERLRRYRSAWKTGPTD